jgi:lipoyl(octanoyl) transferase
MQATTVFPASGGGGASAREELICEVFCLGRVPFPEALSLQRELVAQRKVEEIPDVLLLVEHAPVITLGRNAKREHILSSAEMLRQQGIEVAETNRGGDVTYHGPGQLVGYPILNLGRLRKDVVWYVRTLEEILIRAARDFGIAAGRIPDRTGVWVDVSKLASIGIHVSRWVTSHGFALNLETDLGCFRHIVPCGIPACPVTSFRELLQHPVDRSPVEQRIVQHMGELLGLDMRPGRKETLERKEPWRWMS